MLRLIAGLETRFTGTLRIGGRDMSDVPARQRNIGFVFQNYALFRHMTVAENVAFGLRVQRRMARADITKRVADLLELMQIPQLAGRRPGQLSGGQQQRVALARALATSPELMLMDEPFGALDPMVRKDIRSWLRGLHTQLGLTSVFITHDQGEAIELADRVAVMQGGRILQIGTPDELEEKAGRAVRLRIPRADDSCGGDDQRRCVPCLRPDGSPFPWSGRGWSGGGAFAPAPVGADRRRRRGDGCICKEGGTARALHVECRGRTIELVSTEAALPPWIPVQPRDGGRDDFFAGGGLVRDVLF